MSKIGQICAKYELNPTQKPILKNRTTGSNNFDTVIKIYPIPKGQKQLDSWHTVQGFSNQIFLSFAGLPLYGSEI